MFIINIIIIIIVIIITINIITTAATNMCNSIVYEEKAIDFE